MSKPIVPALQEISYHCDRFEEPSYGIYIRSRTLVPSVFPRSGALQSVRSLKTSLGLTILNAFSVPGLSHESALLSTQHLRYI